MATKDTVVQELVVNTLTQAQFDAAKEAGTLSPYELYGTPDTSVRLPILTPMWFDHITNDVSWLRADTFSWQSGDVYIAAYEHLTEDLESANRLFLAWVSGTDIVYTLDENAGSDVYKQSTSGYMAKQSHHIATGSSVEDERTGDVYTRYSSKDIESKALYTDTIDGNEISYYLASDGHKICTTYQESNISALYESTGVAWYYLLDTENKRFKLPRGKHNKYAETVPVVGNGMSLGLTDGTILAGLKTGGDATYRQLSTMSSLYGADVGISPTSGNYLSLNKSTGVTTDPEKSGIVAQQAQDTDQYKYLYFYVGNFEQDSVEQTAGINAEMFNGKADVDLSNMNASQSAKATIIGWGIPDYSAGVVVANNYVTTFPCYAVARHPSNAMNQTGLSIYVDDIRVFSSSNGNSNANKTFCAVCYVGAGHKVSYTGDGTIEMTIYPLIGVN